MFKRTSINLFFSIGLIQSSSAQASIFDDLADIFSPVPISPITRTIGLPSNPFEAIIDPFHHELKNRVHKLYDEAESLISVYEEKHARMILLFGQLKHVNTVNHQVDQARKLLFDLDTSVKSIDQVLQQMTGKTQHIVNSRNHEAISDLGIVTYGFAGIGGWVVLNELKAGQLHQQIDQYEHDIRILRDDIRDLESTLAELEIAIRHHLIRYSHLVSDLSQADNSKRACEYPYQGNHFDCQDIGINGDPKIALQRYEISKAVVAFTFNTFYTLKSKWLKGYSEEEFNRLTLKDRQWAVEDFITTFDIDYDRYLPMSQFISRWNILVTFLERNPIYNFSLPLVENHQFILEKRENGCSVENLLDVERSYGRDRERLEALCSTSGFQPLSYAGLGSSSAVYKNNDSKCKLIPRVSHGTERDYQLCHKFSFKS